VLEQSLATSFESTDRYEILDDNTVDTSTAPDDGYADSVSIQTENYTEEFDGWFKAPADGDFRFFMACDNKCKLEFDSVNFYGSGTPSLVTLIEIHSSMTFRHYQTKSGSSSTSTPV